MSSHDSHDVVANILVRGAPPSVAMEVQEQFVHELNEVGPIAEGLTSERQPGERGVAELLGQVGLKLLSAGVIKHIAQVMVAVVKRSDRYEIHIGDIKVSKDRASPEDVDRINKFLLQVLEQQEGSKRKKRQRKGAEKNKR